MVYNYTRPRGPIAAMYSSPGPCYGLPGLVGYSNHDPRSNHLRGAQWSFGLRHATSKTSDTPGPAYFVNPKQLRNGKDGTPHYSLSSRHKEASLVTTPGPGAYNVSLGDNCIYEKPPAYSLSSRHKEFSTDDVPGPNKYNADPMLGKTIQSQKQSAPSYSLSSRTKVFGFSETPGAGAYKVTDLNVYKESSPKYTVIGRHHLPTDTTKIPGPGAHCPENVHVNSRSAPQFSFGLKHSQYKGEFITKSDTA